MLTLVGCSIVGLTACGNSEEPPHEHSYSTEWTKTDSHHYYACSCGEKQGYNEHTFDDGREILAPTETEKGEKLFTCSICNFTKIEEISATGTTPNNPSTPEKPDHTHDHKAQITVPKCGKQGYTTYTCECGDSYVSDYVKALEHKYTNYTYNNDAKCGINGTETALCDNGCGTSDVRTKSGTALDHDYGDWVSIGNGVHEKVCKNDNSHVITNICSGGTATCTKKATCKDCSVEYGDFKGHDYNALKKSATEHWYECSCGAYEIKEKHNPGAEATETTDQKCTECNYVITPAIGHVHTLHLTKVDEKAQSCTKEGNLAYYECSCNKWFTDNTAATEITDKMSVVIEKDVHEYKTLKKTTTEHWYECVCGDKKGVETHKGGIATCVDRPCCETCKLEYGKANGHDYDKVVTDPTCTEQGYTTYTCECGDSYVSDYVKALEHKYTNYTYNNDAKCEIDGTETATCSREGCGETHTRTKIRSTLEHDFKDYVSDNNATYEKDGTKTATCSRQGCNETHTITDVGTMLKIMPAAIYLNKSTIELEEGKTETLIVALFPTNASSKIIEWVVLDTTVATVSNGTVTAINEGETLLVAATSNGLTASCSITVFSPFVFASYNGGYTLADYIGNDTEVIVPSTYNGKNVIAVGQYGITGLLEQGVIHPGLMNNTTIEKVVLPEGIQELASFSFNGCTNLREIHIPKTCTKFGKKVFNGCNNFTIHAEFIGTTPLCNLFIESIMESTTYYYPYGLKVVIPNNVSTLCYNSFENCIGLTSIYIGENLTNIGYSEISGEYLDNIIVDENNQHYKSIDGNLYSKDGKTLIRYAIGNRRSTFIIDESVTNIAKYAFKNCYWLQSVTIGNNVVNIGNEAFYSCEQLAALTIGKSVANIGEYAFYNCKLLKEINFNAKNCADLNSLKVFAYAGKNSIGVTVTFGNEVEHVPAYLFYTNYHDASYSPNIKTVTISDSVITIGECALYVSRTLTTLTIGESVKSIADGAFAYCSSLSEIYFNAKNCNDLDYSSFVFGYAGQNGNGINVVFGNKVEHIPANLFNGSENQGESAPKITSVIIGANVKSIGRYAFEECNSLSNVIFEETEGWRRLEWVESVLHKMEISSTVLSNPTTAATYLIEYNRDGLERI